MIRALLACALVLGAFLCGPALAVERIVSFHSDVDVLVDGSMLVEEHIRVVAEGKKIRRGIYRDFPTRYRDRYGNRYVVDFEVLEVLRDGVPERWRSERRGNGVRTYIGDANVSLKPGEYSYLLRYRTDRQLGFFDTHDELYWNVTGTGWEFAIESASARVRLPLAVPAEEIEMTGYTGRQGSREQAVAARTFQGGANIRAQRALQPKEGLTLVMSWPKGVVEEPGLLRQGVDLLRANLPLLLVLTGLAGSALYLSLMWRRYGRDPAEGVIFPHYEPPKGYSPASLRYVRRMGYDNKTFAAAVLNLAVKGHLSIASDAGDYTLQRQTSTEPLAPGEGALLAALFRAGDTLALKQEHHTLIAAARQAHSAALAADYRGKYFRTNVLLLLPSLAVCALLCMLAVISGGFLPVVLLVMGLIVVLHVLFAWLLRAPSLRGRRLMDKSEGFRLYLEVAEKDALNLRNPPEMTPTLFEHYLPFAVALGVEQEWAEQFSAVFGGLDSAGTPYHPEWYRGDFQHHRLASFSSDVGSKFSSAIASAAAAPGSSSGGSGGSSGGGGGGGGGGGW